MILRLPPRAGVGNHGWQYRKGPSTVRYIPPFEFLKSKATIGITNGRTMIHMSHDLLVEMLRAIVVNIEVDEAWYLERYPDVASAVRTGVFKSAKDHFVNNGYFEGRMPFHIQVDESFYLAHNPEVAEFVRRAELASGQQHFEENGYLEGRKPFDIRTS